MIGLLSRALAISLLLTAPALAAETCSPATLAIGGDQIWANLQGEGKTTVVLEAGFGNDSSVWKAIEPRVRGPGVRTLVYDRAGMGQSTIDTTEAYSLDNDVEILRTVLTRCGVTGPVVFVGHSYGGAIGLTAATKDQRIKGVVLLDAVAPGVWTPAEVDKNLTEMRPQYEEIRQKAPALAKVAIPWAEAMPATAGEVNALQVSEVLPIIDIVAEKGSGDAQSDQVRKAAHQAFTAGHPAREQVLAAGSGHKVMVDRPDLVVDAIKRMLARVAKP